MSKINLVNAMRKTSNQFTLNLLDLGKSAIMFGLTSALAALYEVVLEKRMPTVDEWQGAAAIGLFAMIGYLIKNFLDKPEIRIPAENVTPVVAQKIAEVGQTIAQEQKIADGVPAQKKMTDYGR